MIQDPSKPTNGLNETGSTDFDDGIVEYLKKKRVNLENKNEALKKNIEQLKRIANEIDKLEGELTPSFESEKAPNYLWLEIAKHALREFGEMVFLPLYSLSKDCSIWQGAAPAFWVRSIVSLCLHGIWYFGLRFLYRRIIAPSAPETGNQSEPNPTEPMESSPENESYVRKVYLYMKENLTVQSVVLFVLFALLGSFAIREVLTVSLKNTNLLNDSSGNPVAIEASKALNSLETLSDAEEINQAMSLISKELTNSNPTFENGGFEFRHEFRKVKSQELPISETKVPENSEIRVPEKVTRPQKPLFIKRFSDLPRDPSFESAEELSSGSEKAGPSKIRLPNDQN